MPLNILRLNQRQNHPNDRITFIKPLDHMESPNAKAKADVYLRKIAAICYPIMKAHSLSVTTLEEFPPNREFMGRNFNGGEVIQLVLRRMPNRGGGSVGMYGESARSGTDTATRTGPAPPPNGIRVENGVGRIDPDTSDFIAHRDDGGWLPLRTVQMVMMHELAHCIEMNHSKAFWKVRNEYVEHLKVLWARNYTGEGMWGRGQALDTGGFIESGAGGAEGFEDLCGGAYRGRRRRGRKGKEKVSYAERKRRRLEKVEGKFGKGEKVGDSETAKLLYEGKVGGGKPRVANSKRGRDLRAAAALARFERERIEKEREEKVKEEDEETDDGSETESEDGDHLVDEQGKAVTDGKGQDLYRVCGDTDADGDADAKKELLELNDVDVKEESEEDDYEDLDFVGCKAPVKAAYPTELPAKQSKPPTPTPSSAVYPRPTTTKAKEDASKSGPVSEKMHTATCPICSLENEPGSATCVACAHVLDTRLVHGAWQCGSEQCKASDYLNAGDVGVCGICGQSKGKQ